MIKSLKNRSILSVDDLSVDDIKTIFQEAERFKKDKKRKWDYLKGRSIMNFYCETSTRTRSSFELAGKMLSADVINVSGDSSSMSKKGETLNDTTRTLKAMGADLIILRHDKAGAVQMIAKEVGDPVINAGDGWHEHPTQALLDAFTMGNIKGKKVFVVGDLVHSRVFGSLVRIVRKLGGDVEVVAPPTMVPKDADKVFSVKVHSDLDKVIVRADFIYALRIQRERAGTSYIPTIRDYSKLYNINKARIDKAKPNVKVMHAGPINREVDVATEVVESEHSLIEEQVTNGLYIRLALLNLILK